MCRLSSVGLHPFFQTLLSTVESVRLASQKSGSFPIKRPVYLLVARGGGCSCLGMCEFRLLILKFPSLLPNVFYSPNAPRTPPAHPLHPNSHPAPSQ